MTYRDLLDYLQEVEEELGGEEKLRQNITVCVSGDEHYPVDGMYITDKSTDILDPGHLVLATRG